MSIFGSTIRGLREDKKWSLRALGDAARVSASYLSRIERGREPPPPPEIIARIGDALGAEDDVLFSLAEKIDPELERYIRLPQVLKFLRAALTLQLTEEDFLTFSQNLRERATEPTS